MSAAPNGLPTRQKAVSMSLPAFRRNRKKGSSISSAPAAASGTAASTAGPERLFSEREV